MLIWNLGPCLWLSTAVHVYPLTAQHYYPDYSPQSVMVESYGDRHYIDYASLDKSLAPLAFEPFALGTIKPRGWFRQQLELMADGLPGHMHEFYRMVKNATWGGGTEEYSPLNEAWPYYINGLVPLAFALDDQRLLDSINQQIAYVLLRQKSDGWLGPEDDLTRRNFWGRYPFFLAGIQYIEAADASDSTRMLRAVHSFVELMHTMLRNDYQGYVWKQGDNFDEQWGRSRAADLVLALQWLYEHYPAHNGAKIHECMFMIYEKAYDWSWWFSDEHYLRGDIESYPEDVIGPLFPFLHAVNAGQGLKSPAVMSRLVHDAALADSSRKGVNITFEYHGTSSGAIVGDERMSGNSPARGTELCSVVETMFSLSTLHQVLGDASFAERLERAAFNALPAMVMPRWWAHQYVAQTNQPYSYEVPETHFWNVGPWGITFGLEPNYPCCTVNHPQGYPKLLSASWVRTSNNGGIAHVVLLPSDIKTVIYKTVGDGIEENYVHIRCETNYPFSQLLTYYTDSQDSFDFSIRVPDWVDLENPETGFYLDADDSEEDKVDRSAQIPMPGLSGDPKRLKPDNHTRLHTVTLPSGPFKFSVFFSPFAEGEDPKPVVQARPNNAVALTHGPLVFAHTLHGKYTPRRPGRYQQPGEAPPQSNDWSIVPRWQNSMPDSDENPRWVPWNIAIDPSTARVHQYGNLYTDPDCSQPRKDDNDTSLSHESCYNDWPNPIWEEFRPPVAVSVMACEINWNMTAPVQYEQKADGSSVAVRGGYPLPPPNSNGKGQPKCVGRAFPLELKPYGSAKIRMAEFPVVDLSPGSSDLVDE